MHNLPLYIIGAGGLGKEIATLVMDINREAPAWQLGGFFDDQSTAAELSGLPVLGTIDQIKDYTPCAAVLAIGSPAVKSRLLKELPEDLHYPVLIHPSATIQDKARVKLGEGTVIAAGARLTTDIALGKHVLINLNATVGHDVKLGDCCSVMPGVNIAGNVTLGEAVLLGSGANIIKACNVGDRGRVGAGAVVTRDVEPGSTVVGIPAKKIVND